MDSATNSAERRIALLIDGDNISPDYIQHIFPELGRYGVVVLRRVYGDFTQEHLQSWRDVCHTFALQPMHQFSNSVRKNATDIALVIDAMSVLNTENVDGFCIASNDSDFTGLIRHLRGRGIFVIGAGNQDTAKTIQPACDAYIHLENFLKPRPVIPEPPHTPPSLFGTVFSPLSQPATPAQPTAPVKPVTPPQPPESAPPAKSSGIFRAFSPARPSDSSPVKPAPKPDAEPAKPPNPPQPTTPAKPATPAKPPPQPTAPAKPATPANKPLRAYPLDALRTALTQCMENDGWASLSTLGTQLRTVIPNFKSSHYGHSTLSKMLRVRSDVFEVVKDRARIRKAK